MGKGRKRNETNGMNGNRVRSRDTGVRGWREQQRIFTLKQGYFIPIPTSEEESKQVLKDINTKSGRGMR